MSCRPMHINLEVDPSAQEKIVVTLDKTFHEKAGECQVGFSFSSL
jgi:hypothetical protein